MDWTTYIADVWRFMDTAMHAAVILLCLMVLNAFFIFFRQLNRCLNIKRQKEVLLDNVAGCLLDYKSALIPRSPNLVVAHLKLGVSSLRTIATTAPLIGSFASISGVFSAFGAGTLHRYYWLAFNLSLALVPTALGLLVMVIAIWCHNRLCDVIRGFEGELTTAPPGPDVLVPIESRSGEIIPFATGSARYSWEVPYDKQPMLLWGIGAFELYVTVILIMASIR